MCVYPKWQGFYGMEHTPKRTQMPHTLQTAHILKQLKELISWTLTKKQFIILVPISNIPKKPRDLKRWGTDIESPPRHHPVEHTQCERESLSHSVVSDSLWPHRLSPTRLLCPCGFSRQEHWSGWPFPSPGDLLDPGIEPMSPAVTLASRFFTTVAPGKPTFHC